jgi:hypothetical protein
MGSLAELAVGEAAIAVDHADPVAEVRFCAVAELENR